MNIGLCKRCLIIEPLCFSHALPNSIFKYILSKNSGKAILMTDDETTPTQYSSDTWDVNLLCSDSERFFNENYDAYGLSVFRRSNNTVKEASGVRFLKIDCTRLRRFFLSVLWRISVSDHPYLRGVKLPEEYEEELRVAFLLDGPIPQNRYPVAVFKMRDSSPGSCFSNEELRNFVISPILRNYGSFNSVCFVFLSYFVEIFFPKIPKKFAKRDGVLISNNPTFLAPYIEILKIPEIVQLLGRTLVKYDAGLSRIAK